MEAGQAEGRAALQAARADAAEADARLATAEERAEALEAEVAQLEAMKVGMLPD
jgi:tetrahydromethanopterin S-methyltransferase subunit G